MLKVVKPDVNGEVPNVILMSVFEACILAVSPGFRLTGSGFAVDLFGVPKHPQLIVTNFGWGARFFAVLFRVALAVERVCAVLFFVAVFLPAFFLVFLAGT